MIKWDRIWKTRLMRLNTPGLNHSNYISNLSDDFRHYGRILLGKVNENARSVIGCNDHGRPINVHTRKMARSKEWTLSTTMTQFSIFFSLFLLMFFHICYISLSREKKSHENEGKKTGWKEQGKERWVLGIATGTKEGWSFNYVTDTSLSTTPSKGSGEMREFCFFPKSKLTDYVHLSIENATQYWAIAWNISCFKSMKILQPV